MKPVPTSDQLAAIETEVAGKTAQQTALTESVSLQDPIIEQKQLVDDAFKALFDYYNDDIIGPYDQERKALEGSFILEPIVEADILGVGSNPPTGRLVPTPPNRDIVRVPEFDDTDYTETNPINEADSIIAQADVENALAFGYGGSFPPTLATSTTLTPSSTTLSLTSNTLITGISIGTIFIVEDIGDIAVVKVVTVTPNNPPVPPPYRVDLTIELLVPPSGSISSGADVVAFNGFNNTERTNKVAANANLQPLMDYLIAELEAKIADRISQLNLQLSAHALNQDPDAVSQLATASLNANTSKTFLTNYLTTTIISNTGLASLDAERGVRSVQITARFAEILAAYTDQTEDYYEQRYQTANNRGNVERGTLRAVKDAESVKSYLETLADGLGAGIAALNSIIP
jgi:hypothetical protein